MENEIIYAVGIIRASSPKQDFLGDTLDIQKDQIEPYADRLSITLGKKIIIKKWFEFTESASVELDLQPLLKVAEYCENPANKIKYAIVKSIDRSTRAGAEVYGFIKKRFAKCGVSLIDTYGVISTQRVNTMAHLDLKYDWSEYSPSYANEILQAEHSKDEVRDILTRLIGAEVKYVRLGYRVRQAPPGYKNVKTDTPHGKRTILAAEPTEAPWFVKMFELRIQGVDDKEAVKEINSLGYKSRLQKIHDPADKNKIIGYRGGNPLTVKQYQRYIQNPIYAGVNAEKWTSDEPIKEKFNGLVTIPMFNQANRGKITIIDDGDTVKIHRGKLPDWQRIKNKDNPNYPYKKYVVCPTCHNPLLGSAPRSKSGKHIPIYHCGRKHRY